MIYLEKKTAIFSEMVYLEKEKEPKGRIGAEETRLNQASVDETREMDQGEEGLIAKRVQLTKERGYDQVMNTKEEARTGALKKKQVLLQNFIASLRDKLRDFRAGDAYIQREGDIFRGALTDVNEERIRVYLIDQDRDHLEVVLNETAEGKGIHLDFLPLEKKALGGFTASNREESFFTNANFQAKVDSLDYELGKMLHGQLEVEGGMD